MSLSPEQLFLNLSDWYVSRQIEELNEYIKVMERLISEELAREDAELAQEASKLAERDRPDFYADNADYYDLVANTFTNRLRLSAITIAHSIIEQRIVGAAKELGKAKKLKISDLQGYSPIEKARKYMEQFLGIDLRAIPWDTLKGWSKLRNVVAHNDGEVSDEDIKQLQSLVQRFPADIKFNHGRVVVTQSLVSGCVDDISQFNRDLASAIAVWYASQAG